METCCGFNCNTMGSRDELTPKSKLRPKGGVRNPKARGWLCDRCVELRYVRTVKMAAPEPRTQLETDHFHHPIPRWHSGDVFTCDFCSRVLHYTKVKGWSHDPVNHREPKIGQIEGQLTLDL